MALVVRALKDQLAAQPDRLVNGLLTAGVWKPSASFEVTAPGGMFVAVGSGTEGDKAVVEGSNSRQGTYIVENEDGTYDAGGGADVAISPGDASDGRIDLIVLTVYDDDQDSSGQTDALVEVVEGTPAASPSAPSVPDSSIALAEVSVAAGESTAIVTGNITDVRERTGLDRFGAWNMPLGLLDSIQRTSNFDTTSTTFVNLGSVSVSVDADAAGRKVKVSAMFPQATHSGPGRWSAEITDGSNNRLQIKTVRHSDTNVEGGGSMFITDTPSGAKTYKVRVRATDAGTLTLTGGASNPIELTVEDIGPA